MRRRGPVGRARDAKSEIFARPHTMTAGAFCRILDVSPQGALLFQPRDETRLLEMPVAGQCLRQIPVSHHHERDAIRQ